MTIITEEMRYRKKVVEYAIKHANNAKAARKYQTSRMQVKRWRDRYDGTWDSLRNKNTKPHSLSEYATLFAMAEWESGAESPRRSETVLR